MLSHISVHLKSVVLSLLGVEVSPVSGHLLLLVLKHALVDDSILLEMLLDLLLLVLLHSHLVALFSKLIILHLLDKLILVVHALAELLLLDEASSCIHAHHSFLLALTLFLSLLYLTLAFGTAYLPEIVVVHTFL